LKKTNRNAWGNLHLALQLLVMGNLLKGCPFFFQSFYRFLFLKKESIDG